MRQYAILYLLLTAFLLYVAWPALNLQANGIESVFWLIWLVFLFLVIGANLAVVLKVQEPHGQSVTNKQVKAMKN
ncbi:hypothetical protein GCM10011351_10410 [Paraliobacillus quinghaiensis]|uniref:Uncharacterized protein n=1 Tax=Paraliobacillus quinghaiensis TaxID=470815 RepID=A0A917WT59_9BACI|nr:hypothetical protein [Paraliobacillus quinghaiensis]GGM26587.1 hypothetical protein GCM10011351_10410 [Paraliobacillus quinghaiensis]